jgi:hypothetical protein
MEQTTQAAQLQKVASAQRVRVAPSSDRAPAFDWSLRSFQLALQVEG